MPSMAIETNSSVRVTPRSFMASAPPNVRGQHDGFGGAGRRGPTPRERLVGHGHGDPPKIRVDDGAASARHRRAVHDANAAGVARIPGDRSLVSGNGTRPAGGAGRGILAGTGGRRRRDVAVARRETDAVDTRTLQPDGVPDFLHLLLGEEGRSRQAVAFVEPVARDRDDRHEADETDADDEGRDQDFDQRQPAFVQDQRLVTRPAALSVTTGLVMVTRARRWRQATQRRGVAITTPRAAM